MKHGFDADHLAAIDGLTRHNARARSQLARLAGALFSLGHGVVVVGVALGVALGASLAAQAWQAPAWLQAFGAWLSIGLLTGIAALNIAAVLRTPGDEVTPLAGWRCGVFSSLLRASNPATVMAVGLLFALSLDTLSQAALFAVAASQFGGWQPALGLALLFVAGMLLTDGINGWWLWRLIRRSDQTARVASRVMALAVAGVGLLTAALGVAYQTVPRFDAWAQGKEAWAGLAIIAIAGISFILGQQLAGRARAQMQPAAVDPV